MLPQELQNITNAMNFLSTGVVISRCDPVHSCVGKHITKLQGQQTCICLKAAIWLAPASTILSLEFFLRSCGRLVRALWLMRSSAKELHSASAEPTSLSLHPSSNQHSICEEISSNKSQEQAAYVQNSDGVHTQQGCRCHLEACITVEASCFLHTQLAEEHVCCRNTDAEQHFSMLFS